ncbi:hypothetical protein EPI10_028180 [Gossypium australe]|uniref:Uncharacterized protein n=1 Tax=Gossypium australe TaxID=47621 RepID=A0A5B6UZU4_9ROSI|nr:hypothetical protein EPI10_028180 [Gossypium australe]
MGEEKERGPVKCFLCEGPHIVKDYAKRYMFSSIWSFLFSTVFARELFISINIIFENLSLSKSVKDYN